MASGKTTFGRALAAKTGRNFLDLDEEIERRCGRSAADIISQDGEACFRRLESETLKLTASLDNVVIACGGGTPCFRDNMEFMTLHGKTLWLIASPEKLAERILLAQGTRPLVAGKSPDELLAFIKTHLLQRQPYYSRADLRLSGEHLESEEDINNTILSFEKLDSHS